jgi:hypothetical protein
VTDPAGQPTASTINDDQVDALFEGLAMIEALHQLHEPKCLTLQVIETTRQRIRDGESKELDR